MRPTLSDRGFALLEAILALAMLTGSGLVTIGVVRQALAIESGLRSREAVILDADRVLTAMSLLSRSDLDRRLGDREVRGFGVRVSRPTATMYRVSVRENRAASGELLVTLLHRP
jgi:hypothetical protein